MLRNRNLVPLSHQHQHALALCVRIDRAVQAADADVLAFQAEMEELFDSEIRAHFMAEERELFPEAARFPELKPLVEELLSEHAALREIFTRAARRELASAGLEDCARRLSSHIRKEERQLFEECQRLFPAEKLAEVGAGLQRALNAAGAAGERCHIPGKATRLRPRRR